MDTENFIKSIRASKYGDAFEALVEAKRILLIHDSSDPAALVAKDLMKKGFTVNDTNPGSRLILIMLLDFYKTKLNMSNKGKQIDNIKIQIDNIEIQIAKLNEPDENDEAVSSDDENHPYAGKPKKNAEKPKKTRKSRAKYLAKSNLNNKVDIKPASIPSDYNDAVSSDDENHPYTGKPKKVRKPRCKNGTRRVGNECVKK